MVILIRHGEADHNVKRLFDSSIDSRSYLTENGINQIKETSEKIRDFFFTRYEKITHIFCSPLLRTVESARIFKEIMKDANLYKDERFCIDYRIREIEMGKYDKKIVHDYPYGSWNFHSNEKYGGESIINVKDRCNKFLKDLNPYNVNVVITHGEPFRRMFESLIKQDIIPLRGQGVVIEDSWGNLIFNTNEN